MTSPGQCRNRCDSPAAESAALLAAWRLGDTDAGKQLIRRHDRAVARFFRNKVYRDADIVFLVRQVFQTLLDDRQPGADVRASLYRAAYQILCDYLGAGERSDLDVTTLSAEALGTHTSRDIAHAHRPILDALRRLPLEQHVALELTHWENLTPDELAGTLGLPLPKAVRCLRTATAQLRATLPAHRDTKRAETKID